MTMVANTESTMVPDLRYEDSHSDDLEADAEHEIDDGTDTVPDKKRRRLVKNLDKKFECPHPDCDKAYSRAEHLYRHQLNHTPKEIYRCDFAGCNRSFVRSDLCTRHKERHTAKGSHLSQRGAQLQRKDGFQSSEVSPQYLPPASITHHEGTSYVTSTPMSVNHVYQYTPSPEGYLSPTPPVRIFTSGPDYLPPRSASAEILPHNPDVRIPYEAPRSSYHPYPTAINGGHRPVMPHVQTLTSQPHGYDGMLLGQPALPSNYAPTPPGPLNHTSAPTPSSMHSPTPGNSVYGTPPFTYPVTAAHVYPSSPSYAGIPPPAPYGFQQAYNTSGHPPPPNVLPLQEMNTPHSQSLPDERSSFVPSNIYEPLGSDFPAMNVFGTEKPLMRSPSIAVDDQLLTYLFSTAATAESNDMSPSESDTILATPIVNVPPPNSGFGEAFEGEELASFNLSLPETTIDPSKRLRLLSLVRSYGPTPQGNGSWTKDQVLSGDLQDPEHVMSLPMLQTYIASYWVHFHQQIPILHRPTFNPTTCPDLLLLAIMCLGATCLERTHSAKVTRAATELGFFVAYHIRWEVFKDSEFRPTAKLWTFQTMLLLELFEKMYSTKLLHERAHIHHATTVTVMRRGSSLTGRSMSEGNVHAEDPTRTPPGPDGSINASGQNTPDAYWNRWITAEATRRAAFAAFTIDSTHATLFGHSAIMSAHDLRLPLPCDEALWSATSGAEVQRIEASRAANGHKPTTFLEGLKRTLNGQKVRTNTFGRVVLMAGLLNISWNMNQRDLQVSSLGAAATLGSQIKWRGPLTHAFDFWRRDFDESLAKDEQWRQICQRASSRGAGGGGIDHRDNVFESRTCLHSLAHMAMHVDIIDCQVFAGAAFVLGRHVTDSDRAAVQHRMRTEWAPSARARDAVFYALRFLCEVLIPEEELTTLPSSTKSASLPPSPTFHYSACDDYLLNRPWVLYFAALIVWSYGYALDGPLRPGAYTHEPSTFDAKVYDLQHFLIRMGGVPSPDDLEQQKDRNACLGLLQLLQERFAEPRWELLHEASDSLAHCIQCLRQSDGTTTATAGRRS